MTNKSAIENANVNQKEETLNVRKLSAEQMRDYILEKYKDNKEEQDKAMKEFIAEAFTTNSKGNKIMKIHEARNYFVKTYIPNQVKTKNSPAVDIFSQWL